MIHSMKEPRSDQREHVWFGKNSRFITMVQYVCGVNHNRSQSINQSINQSIKQAAFGPGF